MYCTTGPYSSIYNPSPRSTPRREFNEMMRYSRRITDIFLSKNVKNTNRLENTLGANADLPCPKNLVQDNFFFFRLIFFCCAMFREMWLLSALRSYKIICFPCSRCTAVYGYPMGYIRLHSSSTCTHILVPLVVSVHCRRHHPVHTVEEGRAGLHPPLRHTAAVWILFLPFPLKYRRSVSALRNNKRLKGSRYCDCGDGQTGRCWP